VSANRKYRFPTEFKVNQSRYSLFDDNFLPHSIIFIAQAEFVIVMVL